jgi:hypothetical protein
MGFGDHFARALIAVALICGAWPAAAQTPQSPAPMASLDPMFARVIAPRVVALEAKFGFAASELGFGLIVGVDREGRPIVATARHVVVNDEGDQLLSLRARFAPETGFAATNAIVVTPLPEQSEDFAFVLLDQPRGAFGAYPLMPASAAAPLTPVGYLGAGQVWAASTMTWRIDPRQELAGPGQVRASGLSIAKGSSGAPMLGPGVVLGIVSRTRSDGFDATAIERIKQFFDAHFAANSRWLLTPAPVSVPVGKLTMTRVDALGGFVRLIPTTPTPPVALESGAAIIAPAGSYSVQAGEPDAQGGLSGLTCFPSVIEIRPFQELAQPLVCERDLAGRWKNITTAAGYIFAFRKTMAKTYAVVMTDASGAVVGSATAVQANNDSVTLNGADHRAGPFTATLRWRAGPMLEGQANIGAQTWPLNLVRQ